MFCKKTKDIVHQKYLDFVTAYQNGIYNVLALGSASFTDEGLEFLEDSHYIKRIAFALDQDKVGKERTNSIVDRIRSNNNLEKKYFIANYKEEGKDLDEIINYEVERGEVPTLDKIFDFKTLFDFVIEKYITKDTPEEEVVELIIPMILLEDSPIKRADLVKSLSGYLHTFSEETILREINYRLDYEKAGISKRFIKIFEQKKEKILREPKNTEVILNELVGEVTESYKNIYHKEENVFEKTLKNVRLVEEKKSMSAKYKVNLDMGIFDDCTIRTNNVVTIAGRANSFKTTMFVNLSVKALKNNNNTMVFFLSTDDSVEKLVTDFIACIGNLPRVYCLDPISHPQWGLDTASEPAMANQLYKIYIESYSQLEQWIKEKRLIIEHTSNIGTYDSIEKYFKTLNDDKDLKDATKICIIDSLNNISVEDIKDERQQLDFLSKKTKAAAALYNFIMFLNVELKKIGDFYKVSKQDLRGSVKMEYDSDAICVGNNNMHNLKGNTQLYWLNKFGNKQPILCLELEKSKINGKKFYPYFFRLDGDFNQFDEIKPGDKQYQVVYDTWYSELDKYSNLNGVVL